MGIFLDLCRRKKIKIAEYNESVRRKQLAATELLDRITKPLVDEIGFERHDYDVYWTFRTTHRDCPGGGILFHIETGSLLKTTNVTRWKPNKNGDDFKINVGDAIDPEPSSYWFSGAYPNINRFVEVIHGRLAVMCVDMGLVTE